MKQLIEADVPEGMRLTGIVEMTNSESSGVPYFAPLEGRVITAPPSPDGGEQARAQGVEVQIGTLFLGGFECDELGECDTDIDCEAIETLQAQLITGCEPVRLKLFARVDSQPVMPLMQGVADDDLYDAAITAWSEQTGTPASTDGIYAVIRAVRDALQPSPSDSAQPATQTASMQILQDVEPAIYQYRTRADWQDRWGDWTECTKGAYSEYLRVPLHHRWHYEARALGVITPPPQPAASTSDAVAQSVECEPTSYEQYAALANSVGELVAENTALRQQRAEINVGVRAMGVEIGKLQQQLTEAQKQNAKGAAAVAAIEQWRGIFKVIEESGELLQVLGKLGPFPGGDHPDGKGDLVTRLNDEIGDVRGALSYFVGANPLNPSYIDQRADEKREKFVNWGLTGIPSTTAETKTEEVRSHE